MNYNGERWLKVDGTPKAGYAWFSNPTDERQRKVFVPVVPANWSPSDPVHLVAHFTRDWNAPSDWRPEYANGSRITMVGETAPSGVWDYHRMFPSLIFPERVVVMYVGQEPDSSGTADLVFGIGFGLVPIVFLIVLVRRLRARRRIA